MTITATPTDTDHVELYEPPPSRRSFAAGDVIRLLLGIVILTLGAGVAKLAQATVEGIEEDLLRALGRLPDTFESFVLSAAQIATSLIPTVALIVLLVRRRWKVALLLLLTGFVANLAMTLADIVVIDRELANILDELRAEDSVTDSTYPNSHVLASTTAVVTVAAPWLTRRWKRALWWGVALLVVLRLLAVAHPAFDLVVALGVGTIVGSIVLLVFGSPTYEPRPAELIDALRAGGLRPRSIRRDPRTGAALRYTVTDAADETYRVSLRTPDERDADLLARAYRSLRYRASEVDEQYATLKRRIEHEALALTLAERSGVLAPRLVHLGTTSHDAAFVVTTPPPERAVDEADLARPAFLASLWGEVRDLHDAGLAHRHLALETITVDEDGRPWLDEFDGAQTAPPGRELARDVAVLLTETGSVIGARAAVDAAVSAMGRERVAPALRMLQPLALPPSTRARAKASEGLLEALRDEVNRATGEPGLELEELERIKPRTILIVGASALAFYSLLPQLANLSDTVDAFGSAEPWWIVATLVASAFTYVFAAISFQGAVADPVPFAPNLRVQVAASFASLVGPAGAGGFALTGRFLQRVGVGSAQAATSVAVNAIAGFAVHIALLGSFVLWTGQSGLDGFSLPDASTVMLVLTAVLALVGVAALIGPVRERFFAPALTSVRTGLTQLVEVFRRPVRVLALFGGSTGISLTYTAGMMAAVEAFGGGLTFAQVGAAYLAAVAIATLAPTPGGLGALESALIAGLTGFGLGAGEAVSAVLTFRLATFWLPIVPGWFALGWMQRNDEL
ncbi:MAG: lysylphosphatidylglycerol synthase domain-containing protein [Actinomycetota bacterium]|nr:lysylphosphatidylglycerol synthase domain-containing protein [Actinomycetota bacterium]